jgi:hypothetical protein
MKTLTQKTKRMISKYTKEMCIKAYDTYDDGVMGAHGVGDCLKVRINTADALIDAGREIIASYSKKKRLLSMFEKEYRRSIEIENYFSTVPAGENREAIIDKYMEMDTDEFDADDLNEIMDKVEEEL